MPAWTGELIETAGLVQSAFRLQAQESSNRTRNGQAVTVVLDEPYIILSVETEILRHHTQAAKWEAWLARRLGGVPFIAFPLYRQKPNPQLGGAIGTADGSIGISVNASASTITLTGTGAYKARAGDWVSYRTSADGYHCVKVLADANAVSGSVTLAVTPRPKTPRTVSPDVRRTRPYAEFRLVNPPAFSDSYGGGRIAFEAEQVIR